MWYEEWLVFSDLDGTLLDHESYTWQPAAEEVARLIAHGIPLILSSSKTFAEMERLSAGMHLHQPMIVENGGAIAWPREHGYEINQTGRPRTDIISLAHALREDQGYRFAGFSDWGPDDLVEHAHLDPQSAALSLDRHATEPILWHDSEERFQAFSRTLEAENIRTVRGGRFIHLMGGFDKATAMKLVIQHFSTTLGITCKSLALGDSPNDAAMLEAADVAVRIRSAKSHDMTIHSPCLIEPTAPGPHGWAAALQTWWATEGIMNPNQTTNHG